MIKSAAPFRLFFLLLGIGLPQANSLGQSGQEKRGLQAYQWQNRVLLLLAPSRQHSAFQEQQTLFQEQRAAFAERDLVVLEVVGDGPVKMKKGEEAAARLRERYRVSPNKFALLLIGKDGGEKFRSAAPVAPDKIYAIIDAMPMGRSEMREKNKK